MEFSTLITTEQLHRELTSVNLVVVDCRFDLVDTRSGERKYMDAHISGAVYCHLDNDLCGPVVRGKTGRHPLPSVEMLAERFSSWGIDDQIQVVVYDDSEPAPGAIASRLWWSLRWLGHNAVALLDGGWQAWHAEGRPVEDGQCTKIGKTFVPHPRDELLAPQSLVESIRLDPSYRLLDSRTRDRYRGLNETIDPVAGHIPGAISLPYIANVDSKGHFLPAKQLTARFHDPLGDIPAHNVVFYCGSGVTAAHNLLAYKHAGLGDARLYVGSWSDWITDPARPVATQDI